MPVTMKQIDEARARIGSGDVREIGLLRAVRHPDLAFPGIPDEYADRCELLRWARAEVDRLLAIWWAQGCREVA